MRRALVLLCVACVLADAAGAAPQQDAPVRAALLADVAAVRPGDTFTLAVCFEMAPGWRIFWLNPGEAGMATQVALDLPPGFSAGPLSWPAPERFRQPTGAVGFGIPGQAALLAVIDTAHELASSDLVHIRAETAWVACNSERCLPGRASVALELPVTDQSRRANDDVFARARRRIPVAPDSPDTPFSVRRTGLLGGSIELTLDWSAAPVPVEWIPAADPVVVLEDESSRAMGQQTVISMRTRVLTGRRPAAGRLLSVITWTDASGERRGVWVPLPVK